MDPIVKLLKEEFTLSEIDVHELKKMKVGPMKFDLECYENPFFKMSYLKGKALFGLMRMTTIVITSSSKDIPIISYDRIEAGRKDVCIIEMYDTRKDKQTYPKLGEIKKEFIKYPRYEIRAAFSDDIKLKESFAVYSKRSNNFDFLLKEFFKEITDNIKSSNDIDSQEKNNLNKEYVDGLLKNGGTSTDMFVKKLGKEKTEEIFTKYVFFTK